MNISPWTIYWITRVDDIRNLFEAVGVTTLIISLFAAVFSPILWFDESISFMKWNKRFLFIPLFGFICCLFVAVFPSAKDMAAIFVIPKIVNNQKVAEMPSKIVDLATEWLDSLRPKGK